MREIWCQSFTVFVVFLLICLQFIGFQIITVSVDQHEMAIILLTSMNALVLKNVPQIVIMIVHFKTFKTQKR